MGSIIEALQREAAKGTWKNWGHPAWEEYLRSGDEKDLFQLPKFNDYHPVPNEILAALPTADEIDEEGKRFLYACRKTDHTLFIGAWLRKCTHGSAAKKGGFRKAIALAQELGYSKEQLRGYVALSAKPFCDVDGSIVASGEFLLEFTDQELEAFVGEIGRYSATIEEFTGLYLKHAPERWKGILEMFRKSGRLEELNACTWMLPLEVAPKFFLETGANVFESLGQWSSRFDLGKKLQVIAPGRFDATLEKLAVERLLSGERDFKDWSWHQPSESAIWLVQHRCKESILLLKQYLAKQLDAKQWQAERQSEQKCEVLDLAMQKLNRESLPLLEACFDTPQPVVQLRALQLWGSFKNVADTHAIAEKLRPLCFSDMSVYSTKAIRLGAEFCPSALEADLWSLLSHKSRPVRETAANALAKLGDACLPKLKELWAVRRADIRIATVAWLKALGTLKAVSALRARLEDEEDDNVRDTILLALEKLAGGTQTNAGELQARIEKTLAKVKSSPVKWLDAGKLPVARLLNGSPLSADWLFYLLYRQSRVKEMRADIEAKVLYARLDRKTTGDLGLAVLQAYFGSTIESDDRWTMAFAALVGDDRLVPVFTRQIKEWADNMRGKMAEYAVQALALLGTDSALLAVDALAIRYRSKNKNIGKAASDAFAEAAQARGLTVEELGDLVVPWLGFEPGKARLVSAGKSQVEVRLNNDFKFIFHDVATNKKLSKLPDNVATEVKTEFKELAASLKEAVKSQLLRMETLMVRQFRWSVVRWQELYLQHPLLLPFAQRLVWGVYDDTGKLVGTFRAMEDHSLTDAADETYALPKGCHIGLVHPLELTVEERQAWLKHLADYEVASPFAQLERPVVIVKSEQKDMKYSEEVNETELNGLTFKGRAERLGWVRGSVCDAGGVSHYLKSFPTAKVDVFLQVENMYIGIDMYSDITLGKVFFVKHGSVQIGSYVYDEPENDKDERLVSFGQVPAIAFSEAMGDLAKIAKKSEEQAG